MARAKPAATEEVAAHSHADLEKEIAGLKKQVSALKSQLTKAQAAMKATPQGGGKDPRVDKLIKLFELMGKTVQLKKLGL